VAQSSAGRIWLFLAIGAVGRRMSEEEGGGGSSGVGGRRKKARVSRG
jgi:hypothetical protein